MGSNLQWWLQKRTSPSAVRRHGAFWQSTQILCVFARALSRLPPPHTLHFAVAAPSAEGVAPFIFAAVAAKKCENNFFAAIWDEQPSAISTQRIKQMKGVQVLRQ
jgi:hypothetical protein